MPICLDMSYTMKPIKLSTIYYFMNKIFFPLNKIKVKYKNRKPWLTTGMKNANNKAL